MDRLLWLKSGQAQGRRHERRRDLRGSQRGRPVPPAEVCQSPRSGRRRDGDRQDRDPADHRRRFLRLWCPGLHGRREGRPFRCEPARRKQSAGAGACETARHRGLCRPRLPDGLLGPVRREGSSHPHDGERGRAGADGPAAAAQRDAGRRAQHRLQAGGPAGPAAARLQGPAGAAAMGRRECRHAHHRVRQCQQTVGRHHPAPAPDAQPAGRREVLRRAGARPRRHDSLRCGGPRHDQHPGGRPADAEPAPLCDLPAVAAVGTLRGAARGGRSRQAEVRLLLRRGAPSVRRRAQGAAVAHRAGRAPDPFEGRRHLLHHPEPARCAGDGPGPARQPGATRAAGVHAARPEGREGGGRDVPSQQGVQCRAGHHRTRRRRGAAVLPRRQGRAFPGRALSRRTASGPHRSGDGGGAGRGDRGEPARWQV